MFVRDGRDPLIHVLLISHGHGKHLHLAKLIYDKAYTNPLPTPLTNTLACPSLTRRTLRLEGFGDRLVPTVDEQVVDLALIGDVNKLARTWTSPKAGAEVSARVTIGAGQMTSVAQGESWTCTAWSGHPVQCGKGHVKGVWPRPITYRATWTIIDVPRDPRSGAWRLHFFDLDANDTNSVGHLDFYPKPDANDPTRDVVELYVYNTIEDDLPLAKPPNPKPAKGMKSPHFEAYYKITAGGAHLVPILRVTPTDIEDPLPFPSDCKRGSPSPTTAHSSTCIMAQLGGADA